MKSLKEQIEAKRKEVLAKREEVWREEKILRQLEESRVHCEHEWDKGVKGYEHEGVYCIKCGINDLYADTLKRYLKVANEN